MLFHKYIKRSGTCRIIICLCFILYFSQSSLEGENSVWNSQMVHLAEFRLGNLIDENGMIPLNAYTKARSQIKKLSLLKNDIVWGRNAESVQLLEAFDGDGGIDEGNWRSLGPEGIGGRIRSCLVNPANADDILIGSSGGGIWRSEDGGASWSPTDDFMNNLAVSCMVRNPIDSNIIYAGTGDGFSTNKMLRGSGIFKSADGGSSWTHLPSTLGLEWLFVNRLAINKDGTVMLAALDAGLFRSTDGGDTWTQVLESKVDDVKFSNCCSMVGIAGGDGGNAWYSRDGGATWLDSGGLGAGGRVECALSVESGVVWVSVDLDHGTIYKSSDGGESFQIWGTPGHLADSGEYANLIWVDAADANNIYVGGENLYKLNDSEKSWIQVSRSSSSPVSVHSFQHILVPHSDYGREGEEGQNIVYCCNDGGIYKADLSLINGDDAGSGWLNLNNNLSITAVFAASGSSETGSVIAGTDGNGTLVYHGEASHWSMIMRGTGGKSFFSNIGEDLLYGSTPNLGIYRNSYGGYDPSDAGTDYINGQFLHDTETRWKDAPYLIPDARDQQSIFIAPAVVDSNIAGGDRILAGGLELWLTDNGNVENGVSTGPVWRSIKDAGDSFISAIAVAPGNSDMIWVGYVNGDLYLTENGTDSAPIWVKLDDGDVSLPDRKINSILLGGASSSRVYVGFGGFSEDNIYFTDSKGSNWLDATGGSEVGLPDLPVNVIVSHPDNDSWLYAGTEMGLFASSDAGFSWSVAKEGPANCCVTDLFWMKSSSDIPILAVSTYGRGVFETEIEYEGASAQISIGDIVINEGDEGETRSVEFRVQLQDASRFPVTVNYESVDGTALVSDNDYSGVSGTLTFQENSVQYISVDIMGDGKREENEVFSLELSEGSDGVIIAGSPASCMIADDDNSEMPSVALSTDSDNLDEDSGRVEITATLSSSCDNEVSVYLDLAGSALGDGIDYSVSSRVITIPAGETSGFVSLTGVSDEIYEGDEDIAIAVATVVNALDSGSSVDLMLKDGDLEPQIIINDITVTEGDEAGVTGVFNITLSVVSTSIVSVDYSTVNNTAKADSDYVGKSGTITFNAGESIKKISIDIIGDAHHEEEESFFLHLSEADGGRLTSKSDGECLIVDNDLPEPAHLSINSIVIREGDSPDYYDARFEVVLSGSRDFPVAIDYNTEDGTATTDNHDYYPASGTLSFVSNGTAFLSVRIYGDDDIEDNEDFFVNLSTDALGIEPSECRGRCFITDDDDPNMPVVTLSADTEVMNETDGVAVVTALLSNEYDKDVTVNLEYGGTAEPDGVDYNASSATITIPSGSSSGFITIAALSDNLDEFDENIDISIKSVINGIEEAPQLVSISIPDSDGVPNLSIDSISVNEGDLGTVSGIFKVSLDAVSGKTVSVAYQVEDGTAMVSDNDYFQKSGTISFEAGEQEKNLEFLIICDEKYEDDETFSVLLSGSENADIANGEGICTIINDDSSEASSISVSDVTVKEGSTDESVPAEFAVTLSNTKHFPVTVSYMTIDNTAHSSSNDYISTEGTLTFNDNETHIISVMVNGDELFEGDETFFVNLYNVSPGVEYEKHLGVCTITDDDMEPPSVSLEDIHVPEPDDGETADAVFTLVLTHEYPVGITVDYTTVDGTAFSPGDYTAASGTVTFEPGSTEKRVSIIVNGDFDDESDEVFILKLLNPINVTIEDSMGVCFIEDDDTSYTLYVGNGSGGGEHVNGERVEVSADPPEKGKEFKNWIGSTEYLEDPESSETFLVMPAKNLSITATYESTEKITVGSILYLNAADIPDMNLSLFTKKPKLYCMIYDYDKEKNIKLSTRTITKVSSSVPTGEVRAVLKKTSLLYSKTLWKDAQKAGILTSSWLSMNPWQNTNSDTDLFVKTVTGSGDKIDLYVRTALIAVPEINGVTFQNNGSIEKGVDSGAILLIKGKFFGSKAPKLSIEYIFSGVVRHQKLKVLKPLRFADAKGGFGKSCMDLTSSVGYSEILVQLPVGWWQGWHPGEYDIVLINKTGLATFKILTK